MIGTTDSGNFFKYRREVPEPDAARLAETVPEK